MGRHPVPEKSGPSRKPDSALRRPMSIRVPVHVEECPVQAAISEDPHRDVSAWDGLCWGRLGSRVGSEVRVTSRPPAQDHLCMAITSNQSTSSPCKAVRLAVTTWWRRGRPMLGSPPKDTVTSTVSLIDRRPMPHDGVVLPIASRSQRSPSCYTNPRTSSSRTSFLSSFQLMWPIRYVLLL
jgi:hypothetical protein